MGWGSGTAQFPYLVDPLSAITSHISSQQSSAVIKSALNDTDLPSAIAAASAADTCLVFVTADSGEGEFDFALFRR